ncbi:COBRA-like protein 10 precursor [Hibiscus trionum]|uniref:COBRA-like protein 10 n=1 Tax=Hibiscus trionum TaxID=183268 RepID=A0A9W7MQV8_HIBTR|nr:COBRA-like protein 10 precursor [Hibiscus trionum]
MKMPWMKLVFLPFLFIHLRLQICYGDDLADDYADDDEKPAAPPPAQTKCNGVFLTYTFTERSKELPLLKNVSAQAWAFRSSATILNTGLEVVKGWKIFIGFQHREILVSANNAVLVDGAGDFPANVSKGATLAGYPNADLETSVDTAADYTKMQVQIDFTGTMFGLKQKAIPLPKSIRLVNDGWKCPKLTKYSTYMYSCCRKDPKYKKKNANTGKFAPRQYGDVNFVYDVLKSYEGSYEAQVTIDNNNPLSCFDNWNLTWEWMRGEFIYSMRGAYTRKIDYSECIFGLQGQYLSGFDFGQVMNCEKRPVISDLPLKRANDSDVGLIPYCCRDGSILSPVMDKSKARSIFQLRVYKIPPDVSKTVLYPPQRWNITSLVSAQYKCGPPTRVDPTDFPDPDGLDAKTYAVASWQVVCNMTKPEKKQAKCCVSFTAYYSDAAVPCSTCACGCDGLNTDKCNPDAKALALPTDALLVPAENRTLKIKALASLKHKELPKRLPCPDNCGVSVNWHIISDHKGGWTARITLFNWGDSPFKDWFAAVQFKKAFAGYSDVYSFNATKLSSPKNTIFIHSLKGSEYLVGEVNGSSPSKPRVPGKQQSVIGFTKKNIEGLNVRKGDGFPSKVFFNGAECALPGSFPNAATTSVSSMAVIFLSAVTSLLMMTNRFL